MSQMICAACGQKTEHDPCEHCNADPILERRYQLERVIGQGSAGTTYQALDRATGTMVAVKEMLLRRADSLKARELMTRESTILRQLDHPGIPRFEDSFLAGAGKNRAIYLVEEFVEGRSLREELASHRYQVHEVLAIAEGLLEILCYLHQLSPPVIHRDIKPSNVMRRKDGRLVLIDFGSVRDAVDDLRIGGSTVAGTFGYMAPEQLAGDASPASDLYAVGVLMVALLSRKEPQEMLTRYQTFDWEPHVRVSPPIAELLKSLLASEPGERASSASEVLASVRDIELEGDPTTDVVDTAGSKGKERSSTRSTPKTKTRKERDRVERRQEAAARRTTSLPSHGEGQHANAIVPAEQQEVVATKQHDSKLRLVVVGMSAAMLFIVCGFGVALYILTGSFKTALREQAQQGGPSGDGAWAVPDPNLAPPKPGPPVAPVPGAGPGPGSDKDRPGAGTEAFRKAAMDALTRLQASSPGSGGAPSEVALIQPLEAHQRTITGINTGTYPPLGPDNSSALDLIIFSDFQCPYCARLATTLKDLREHYGERISIHFRDYPLAFHTDALLAHKAARCAAELGSFWPMHDTLLANYNELSEDRLLRYGDDIGLSRTNFVNCLHSDRWDRYINEDIAAAKAAGVRGVPATFINGQNYAGARPLDEFITIIDEALGKQGE